MRPPTNAGRSTCLPNHTTTSLGLTTPSTYNSLDLHLWHPWPHGRQSHLSGHRACALGASSRGQIPAHAVPPAGIPGCLDCEPNDVLQPVVETVKVTETVGSDAGPALATCDRSGPRSVAPARVRERPGAPPADHVCPLRSGEALPAGDLGRACMRKLRVAFRTDRHDLPGMWGGIKVVDVLRRAAPPRLLRC